MKIASLLLVAATILLLAFIVATVDATTSSPKSLPQAQHPHHARMMKHGGEKMIHNIHKTTHTPTPHTVASTSNSTATLKYFWYQNNGECQSGNPPQQPPAFTHQTGQCIQDNPGIGSMQYFCNGDYGYLVVYGTNNQCNEAMVTEIYRYALGCASITDGISDQYACQNPSFGPTPPSFLTSWPPANFIVQTTCRGLNSQQGTTYCSADPSDQILCQDHATPAGVCVQQFYGSTYDFCTEDGEYVGYAHYVSSDCSDAVPAQVYLQSTACNTTAGVSNTLCTGTPFPVDQYPQAGIVVFQAPNPDYSSCSNMNGPGTIITMQNSGECFQGRNFTCSTNDESFYLNSCSSSSNYSQPTQECQLEQNGLEGVTYFCGSIQL